MDYTTTTLDSKLETKFITMKKNYNYSHKYIINHHKPSYTMPFSGLCFTNIASSPERSHLADPELGVYGGLEPPNGRRGAPDVW